MEKSHNIAAHIVIKLIIFVHVNFMFKSTFEVHTVESLDLVSQIHIVDICKEKDNDIC